MYAHLSLFESKPIYVINGPLFPITKHSTSIHKNNPAFVVSIVLQKHYFHSKGVFKGGGVQTPPKFSDFFLKSEGKEIERKRKKRDVGEGVTS